MIKIWKLTPLKCAAVTVRPMINGMLPLRSFLLPSQTPWITKTRIKVKTSSKNSPLIGWISGATSVKPKLPLMNEAGSKAWKINQKKKLLIRLKLLKHFLNNFLWNVKTSTRYFFCIRLDGTILLSRRFIFSQRKFLGLKSAKIQIFCEFNQFFWVLKCDYFLCTGNVSDSYWQQKRS